MMTLANGLLAIACYFLWRNQARWGWIAVMVVLVIGIVIFMRDVDFNSNLGIQL